MMTQRNNKQYRIYEIKLKIVLKLSCIFRNYVIVHKFIYYAQRYESQGFLKLHDFTYIGLITA